MFASIARLVSVVVFAAAAGAASAGQHGQVQAAVGGPGYAVAASSRFVIPASVNGHRGQRAARQLAKLERQERHLEKKLAKLERREQRIRGSR